MKIDFSKIKDLSSKKRIEFQDNDKLLLRFIADNKYVDDITARILLDKKSRFTLDVLDDKKRLNK